MEHVQSESRADVFSWIELYAVQGYFPRCLMASESRTRRGMVGSSGSRHRSTGKLALGFLAAGIVLLVLASILSIMPVAAQVGPAVVFNASLSPVMAGHNQTIRVTLSDTNLLPLPNEPSGGDAFRARNLTGEPCGATWPMGVALYQGRFTLQNLSTSKYLPVVDEFTPWNCPEISNVPFKLTPFWTDAQTMDLSGYWTSGEHQHPGGGVSLGMLHPFAPGEYTLIAGDAWGHAKILYFRVVG